MLSAFTMVLWAFLVVLPPVCAYIPAQPTNDTDKSPTNVSTLQMQWFPNGLASSHGDLLSVLILASRNFGDDVSYQLVGAGSLGISKVCSLWNGTVRPVH
jgi:hypothetical protein